jgi:D-glycerate 3-kinase
MAGPDPHLLEHLAARVEVWRERHQGLFVLGICGAQGSGKTTLAAALAARLAGAGVRVARLSLDDLYLTRAARQQLAGKVHPLFATRGVPGTHDVALGMATIAALARGEPVAMPRFDKAQDDRAAPGTWPLAPAGTQVLLFEGWCLGAAPEPDVSDPINALETDEDPSGAWRRHANAALAGPYAALFAQVHRLVLLAAPGFEVVARWREEQEAQLRVQGGPAVMTPNEVSRFIAHYERLTHWILAEMPGRADLTVRLGRGREVLDL